MKTDLDLTLQRTAKAIAVLTAAAGIVRDMTGRKTD